MTQGGKWSECDALAQPSAPGASSPAAANRPRVATRWAACALAVAVSTSCSGEDAPRELPIEERTPKVLLIGIDGVRVDVLAEVPTPNIDRLAATGTFTQRTRTTTPSVSGPAWSSMLTGVWPEKHGVTDNEFEGRRYDTYPGFLTRIEQARPELSTFAVADWTPLMELEGGSTAVGPEVDRRAVLDGYALGWAEADAQATALAIEEITRGDPDAMFVYLGNADETSHQTGSIGTQYRDAIAMADRQVGLIIDAVRARPAYGAENWLILLSTDHGRTDDGDHGGNSPVEMTTFLLTSGPAAAVDTVDGESFIVDVAVTALAHMGIEIEPAWGLDGRPRGLR